MNFMKSSLKLLRKITSGKSPWPITMGLGIILLAGFISYVEMGKSDHVDTSAADAFMRGEYYFNSHNSPDGEYNLSFARQYYTEAIDKGSEEKTVWYQLGRIDFLEGKYDAALFKFDKQLSLYQDQVPNVYYLKGLTYGYKARKGGDSEDWKKAEENFQKYLEHEPESPWVRTDLSWVYFSEGKFSEMLPIIEDGLSFEPHNPWLLNMHGLALLNTGEKQKAHEQFLAAAEYAGYLTPEEWGQIYPGNDPGAWEQGLKEFQSLIAKNLELTKSE